MRIKVLLGFLLFLLISFAAKSQDSTAIKQSSGMDLSLEGMIGVSFGNNFYSVNVGGPALFLVLNKNLKVGIGALPSLYSLNGKLGARLGVSPRIDYKNLVLIAPFFHRDTADQWVWSVGFGYKFHKK
ncbi:hypothetical protein [Aquiflexum sp.]|uniref:hypothetical protein n=1 Tax=Aquiflexum sp. TaxID=1872584 RepID=UPI0035935C95